MVTAEDQGNDHGHGGGDTTADPPNGEEAVADMVPDSTNGVGVFSHGNGESPYEDWQEWLTDAQPHDPFKVTSPDTPAMENQNADSTKIWFEYTYATFCCALLTIVHYRIYVYGFI